VAGRGAGSFRAPRRCKKPGRPGGKVLGLRVLLGCGLLTAVSLPAAPPRWQLDSNPSPPTQAQINAAENQVRQHQAALGAEQGKLTAASTMLGRLQTQAEVVSS
jgi:hypothetical protein